MKYYTKAQENILEMHSEQDPQILECLKSIGDIYLHQGNLEKATSNFNEALKICLVIFGE